VKRTHYVSFHNFLSKCSIPLTNNMTVSSTSVRVQRFYVTVGMKYHIAVKSYSSTDPMWSSSSMSSRLVNSLPHLISPWHAQKNVHDKWALTQPQRAVDKVCQRCTHNVTIQEFLGGASWTSDGTVRGISFLLASSRIQTYWVASKGSCLDMCSFDIFSECLTCRWEGL